jgi:hypothetical protein
MLRHGRLITSHADKKPERVFAWYFLFFIELDLRLNLEQRSWETPLLFVGLCKKCTYQGK